MLFAIFGDAPILSGPENVRSTCPHRICNRLLQNRSEDWDPFGPHLEAVTLKERQVMGPAKPITHAYFLRSESPRRCGG